MAERDPMAPWVYFHAPGHETEAETLARLLESHQGMIALPPGYDVEIVLPLEARAAEAIDLGLRAFGWPREAKGEKLEQLMALVDAVLDPASSEADREEARARIREGSAFMQILARKLQAAQAIDLGLRAFGWPR